MGEVIWLASTSRCGNTSNEMGRYAAFGALMRNIDDGSPLSADTEA